jgi:hypothetical protein
MFALGYPSNARRCAFSNISQQALSFAAARLFKGVIGARSDWINLQDDIESIP